ncbi:MAG: pantoate--beta-alanine ligase [Firmicutes bacterium]|nr:pantoate--beta-alanine ligase [Bacillota bacterium]
MRLVKTIRELKQELEPIRRSGVTVGFVPTMGYLHEGHLSLMRKSVEECGFTVVSIFVNPTQFGPGEDYDRYPRDLERDLSMCESVGVDLVFAPGVSEMYEPDACTRVTVSGLTQNLCGRSRPGHFDGVTTVVCKLFNMVRPDRAYFGQKDAQQVAVVRRMVRDLNIPVEVREMPTVREPDGLAMSSRNVYLSPDQRRAALSLHRSLRTAADMIEKGERSAAKIRERMIDIILSSGLAELDYVEIVDADSLRNIDTLKGEVLIAVAVKFGQTRLIDNIKVVVH